MHESQDGARPTDAGEMPPRRPGSSRLAQWAIAFFLGVIAACLLLRSDVPIGSMALAQPSSLAGARGVFAFTGQISKDRYGVFMVDVDQGTIWCYEVDGSKMNLFAGRSWRFDRYLERFNEGGVTVDEVEGMVEQQRRTRSPVPPNPPSKSQPTSPTQQGNPAADPDKTSEGP